MGKLGSVEWSVTRRLACGSVPAVALTLGALAIWPFDQSGNSRIS